MPAESRSSPREIQNYLSRISGPLLDRIDLHIEVPPVKFREITSEQAGEPSAQIRERVIAARQRQHARFRDKPKITCNARMGSRELKSHCVLDEATMELLKFAMTDLNLSARAYDRVRSCQAIWSKGGPVPTPLSLLEFGNSLAPRRFDGALRKREKRA